MSTPTAGASRTKPSFPFPAVVGQDQLQLALILNAITPGIGGVVIRGEKGTAKTTTVRAFAALLDGAPLVNLPIGATEDRVVGSIDMETVLTTGKATFNPGLLSQADGGVLYVDEVNLLADHLVDALLDAAATGQVTVERDGISHTTPASFVLVGTMNPEEGELRPQLLDRFGLAVDVAGSKDVQVRAEIIRRRLAFEADPNGFAHSYAEQTEQIAQQIRQAKAQVEKVVLSDTSLMRIAHICAAFDVDGMRADLVIARTAIAHAAWRGADAVEDQDIKVAAELALPHRRRRDPFDEPGLDQQQLEDTLDQAQRDIPDSGPDSDTDPETAPETNGEDQAPESPQTQFDGQSDGQSDGQGGRAELGAPFRTAPAAPRGNGPAGNTR
ncbi:AAA family ATPase [Corynebacterium sp. 153RC1]|uniref:ATP-binding protein n=1 Tax=unclassified Corynebacterium TaxID=2624378 RepID=UPI00211BB9DF|nr:MULTISPECIES: AAA family ATPase [unclassified Corynebacterium]MCQ9351614.1 AAA family ATPase [Corynebacterium sp. 209RC1]MCQ9353983.1 AAA family ATPase [Corynebacterium sp. 1222RC1]MCQ9355897.1 AAA family ATPase [Corynebacterium sp. 122RC1]MCQ9358141.1 AAA family ATPase [Corynebacterium sp. 142RC1]MCQ9360255.1 AAA family ATPase [Corynebacterium sp. 153RC1]